MKNIILITVLAFSSISFAQVGINTTSPNATLDIAASDKSTPTEKDGILIPRVDRFPSTEPGANQDAMLIYLTTTFASKTPGFYYWNDASKKWLSIKGEESWNLSGNTGTDSTTDFLGTTDPQDLSIRTNNTEFFKFTTKGQLETFNRRRNILFGNDAGNNLNTNYVGFGADNIFIGENSGKSNVFGTDAIAIGSSALESFSTRDYAIAIGSRALSSATNTDLINLQPGTAPTTPAEGDVYYDATLKKLRVYTGSVWENLN